MKKRIIICGYPKSGNTWLTRLTAEIVRCPVEGFWCEPLNEEESIEGGERVSDFACFKSHHTYPQLERTLATYGRGDERILYIHRDPRDVVVSASNYFVVGPAHPRLHAFLAALPCGLRLYYRFLHDSGHALRVLSRGLVEGTREGSWLKSPWHEHVVGYLEAKRPVLVLSYESLKQDPLEQARRVCAFLGLERTEEAIAAAVHAQSFTVKKQAFLQAGRKDKAAFLRQGRHGSWREVLEPVQLDLLEGRLGPTMQRVGYRLSTETETSDKLPQAADAGPKSA